MKSLWVFGEGGRDHPQFLCVASRSGLEAGEWGTTPCHSLRRGGGGTRPSNEPKPDMTVVVIVIEMVLIHLCGLVLSKQIHLQWVVMTCL